MCARREIPREMRHSCIECSIGIGGRKRALQGADDVPRETCRGPARDAKLNQTSPQ